MGQKHGRVSHGRHCLWKLPEVNEADGPRKGLVVQKPRMYPCFDPDTSVYDCVALHIPLSGDPISDWRNATALVAMGWGCYRNVWI